MSHKTPYGLGQFNVILNDKVVRNLTPPAHNVAPGLEQLGTTWFGGQPATGKLLCDSVGAVLPM